LRDALRAELESLADDRFDLRDDATRASALATKRPAKRRLTYLAVVRLRVQRNKDPRADRLDLIAGQLVNLRLDQDSILDPVDGGVRRASLTSDGRLERWPGL
jgi:hypothetical protein